MEAIELKGYIRKGKGKGSCRKLRKDGWLPGILYGGDRNVPISIELKRLQNIIAQGMGENIIFQLRLEDEDKEERNVIIRELQIHPVTRELLHIDLYELSMEKTLRVDVPIVFTGEPIGVTQKEGILHHQLKELSLECLPASIPEHIVVDITELDIGDVIHVKDLKLNEGLKVLTDPDKPVVSITGIAPEEISTEEPPVEESE
jgi:large subunit ribosomal protein L25